MPKSFFISSTYSDLKNERELLKYQIESMGHKSFGFEDMPPSFPLIKKLETAIEASDFTILLIGDRYGSLDSNGKSFVENEYNFSLHRKKPVLIFIKQSSKEGKNDAFLEAFRLNLLKKHFVYFWENESELLSQFVKTVESINIESETTHKFALYNPTIDNTKVISDIRVINNLILEKIKFKIQDIHKLNSRQFEILVAELFEKEGYKVHLTKETRDGGKDLMVLENNILGNFLIYAECKKYSPQNHVGVRLVRELYGTVMADKATAGIMITSSYFSNDAKEYSEKIKHQMNLIDYNFLYNWINKHK